MQAVRRAGLVGKDEAHVPVLIPEGDYLTCVESVGDPFDQLRIRRKVLICRNGK